MVFSKTFGYAVRGILYISLKSSDEKRAQIEEMAGELNIPRHFLAKVMKRMAKEGIIESVKGTNGGFSVSGKTLSTPLLKIVEVTGDDHFSKCVLRLDKCSKGAPCPFHKKVEPVRQNYRNALDTTTIDHLINGDTPDIIKSLIVK